MFERVREAVRWVVLLARFVVSIVPLLLRSVAGTIARAFDPYTGQARRAIQFARLEACRFSTKTIETEHLLLGLLHQHQHLSAPDSSPKCACESYGVEKFGHSSTL